MSFNKETLINLGEHHKKIMKMIDTNLKKLTTTKELYYLIENYDSAKKNFDLKTISDLESGLFEVPKKYNV